MPLPRAPFERILRQSGPAVRASDDATRTLATVVEEIARQIAADAARFARHAGRTTISGGDVVLAARQRRLGEAHA